MGVNSAHPDYVAAGAEWSRARDVLAGEDAVKAAGDKYLPKLDSQSEEEYSVNTARAAFFGSPAQSPGALGTPRATTDNVVVPRFPLV